MPNEERIARVDQWLSDPVTRQFMQMLAAQARSKREASVDNSLNMLPQAYQDAAQCEAFRWILSDGIDAMRDEKRFNEIVMDEEAQPEEKFKIRLKEE